MSRFGIIVALLILAGIVAFAAMVRVTGPGWSGAGGPTTGPQVARAPAPVHGKLVLPVQGVQASALHDDWGEARGDGTRVHHAIDIMAPTGTPVLAAADGTIEKLFQSKLGGTTIYERSTDGGIVYYYAHLDRYAPTLVEGQAVKAGQQIATVGSTGDAAPSAPHLHFEIHRMAPGEGWWQGEEINPYPVLAGK
ncbi:M23 family metallopeptidase [Sphingomonas sp. CGMCC 1.13654]|uniref:M23 family metallopeptidase n=1 Tax=Sphingomonas chungangi TaxID=2683589 RepID=A0A838LEB1_9SPHN|nr:M23 family metallopeptidase [Sphingomonas chungangi]MBA2935808.1 M23 family metallopeptidase [Sphingomonas chungangi]MVW54499.1 peptidoglycan DD-metalloendopeptidase family protein [Sphingomonas chungangi]